MNYSTTTEDAYNGELCTICGEPATVVVGRLRLLCQLPTCEIALLNEINLELDETASDSNEGAEA